MPAVSSPTSDRRPGQDFRLASEAAGTRAAEYRERGGEGVSPCERPSNTPLLSGSTPSKEMGCLLTLRPAVPVSAT
jgi:hypothetical protein